MQHHIPCRLSGGMGCNIISPTAVRGRALYPPPHLRRNSGSIPSASRGRSVGGGQKMTWGRPLAQWVAPKWQRTSTV